MTSLMPLLIFETKKKLKGITTMLKAKEVEFGTRNNELCKIVSRLTKEVIKEFFIFMSI